MREILKSLHDMKSSIRVSANLSPMGREIRERACEYLRVYYVFGLAEVRAGPHGEFVPTEPQLSHNFPTPQDAFDSAASTSRATPSLHCVHTSFYEERASAGTSRIVHQNFGLLTSASQRHERSRQIPTRYAHVASLNMSRYWREAFYVHDMS
jgi:hypothetical protein